MIRSAGAKKPFLSTETMVFAALGAALLCVCSLISIPAAVPFTLQTFGVFVLLVAMGGARGTLSVALYIALGAVGLPVFSGGRGGPAALFGPTGGFIIGFLLSGVIYILLVRDRQSLRREVTALVLGELAVYLFGLVWFMVTYSGDMTVSKALSLCVWPFLLPDLVKLSLALLIGRRVRRALRTRQ